MFGKIVSVSNNMAYLENTMRENESSDIMNVHVVFEAEGQKILGEVNDINSKEISIRFLGEFVNGRYITGVIRKPLLSSTIRLINDLELEQLVGKNDDKSFLIGSSAIYTGKRVCADINTFFSNHMAIFGNSGAGKSWGVARLVQNVFSNPNFLATNANLFFFDAYGEYKSAFSKLHEINSAYSYKFITTNIKDPDDCPLQIPLHLLSLDDFTLLLQASNHSQLPIIERTIRLAKIFSQNDDIANRYKNHLIAKALLAVLFSNQTTANKKNEIFTIIEACSTLEFNFNSTVKGLGYTRNFSECFEIDSNGNFGESVLVTEYILSFINDDLESTEEPLEPYYTIKDYSKALEFTLISEGFQNNKTLFDDAIILKVRLNSIINSRVQSYFTYPEYITLDEYIKMLLLKNGQRAQIININLEDIDDTYAKCIVKILSRFFFEFSKSREERASVPFHIFLEEAHRYVQKDTDTFLIGYNIFDRIAKEGRKYGVLLNIISQRPVEISDTVISQMSNFLIFKMTHPLDLEYIEKMLPNISSDVIEKQKSLQPGSCVGFGSAFKLSMIMRMDPPNPGPQSQNCDVNTRWRGNSGGIVNRNPVVQQPIEQAVPAPNSVNSIPVQTNSVPIIQAQIQQPISNPVVDQSNMTPEPSRMPQHSTLASFNIPPNPEAAIKINPVLTGEKMAIETLPDNFEQV